MGVPQKCASHHFKVGPALSARLTIRAGRQAFGSRFPDPKNAIEVTKTLPFGDLTDVNRA
ncbi:MAG: hypothetical protein AAF934_07495 [Bacteroidota bacterium]